MNTNEFSESDLSQKSPGHQNDTQKREVRMALEKDDLDQAEKYPHLSDSGSQAPRSKK